MGDDEGCDTCGNLGGINWGENCGGVGSRWGTGAKQDARWGGQERRDVEVL